VAVVKVLAMGDPETLPSHQTSMCLYEMTMLAILLEIAMAMTILLRLLGVITEDRRHLGEISETILEGLRALATMMSIGDLLLLRPHAMMLALGIIRLR
jgi:hypothetical protein